MSSTLLEDEVKLAQAARYLNVTPRYLLHLLEQRRLTLDI
jgi:predicted HTH domain antitoxin